MTVLVAWLGERESVFNGVAAREAFFVDWRAPPTEADLALLRRLSQSAGALLDEAAPGVLMTPRFGAESPWSSKATAIARRCGLESLRRLERGWLFDEAAFDESLCDKMTRQALRGGEKRQWRRLFAPSPAAAEAEDAPVKFGEEGADALRRENAARGLALSEADIRRLSGVFAELGRDPTIAELATFAQANSEHCRHKIFNAEWEGGGESLMRKIRRTHAANPKGVVVAFADNAAIFRAAAGEDFFPAAKDGVWRRGGGGLLHVAKAETHNHPTAVSPFFGAATGAGGEMRDEAAAGRGAAPVAGFCGYVVSRLGFAGDSPLVPPPPPHVASAAKIAREAPLGAAAFANEFGRPALAGFFRSYECAAADGRWFGFHKPVMLAGGVGQMSPDAVGKKDIPPGAKIAQLGGPGFRIGIGGGAASSRAAGGDAGLDFASVQRDNAEMQRRAQMALDAFRRRPKNPILSLHDVGAGGLGNAVCELVFAAGRGARIVLSDIPVGEGGMSAAEIWLNESQERHVVALPPAAVAEFAAVCARERCPFAVIGEATENRDIVVVDDDGRAAVDLPLSAVLGDFPLSPRRAEAPPPVFAQEEGGCVLQTPLAEAGKAVLRHPAVACKRFLIVIGDRTVGGLTARDQMVGPWQTPVADCAVVCNDFVGVGGVAFALGERPPVAAIDPPAASRLAIAEALLNLAAADADISAVKLSLNWMANCGDAKRDGELRAAVGAASDFCVAVGVGVIVGKDSLSMRTAAADGRAAVESPAFAAAFAFAPVADVRRTLTPQLSGRDDTILLRIGVVCAAAGDAATAPADSGDNPPPSRPRLAASAAAQCGVFAVPPRRPPDISAAALSALLATLSAARREGLLLAYHDCSDGGLWAALCEMAFAANMGLDIFADAFAAAAPETDGLNKDGLVGDAAAALFGEEVAIVAETTEAAAVRLMGLADEFGRGLLSAQTVARPQSRDKRIRAHGGGDVLLDESLSDLRRVWEEVGGAIAAGRDNPASAAAERDRDMEGDPGLFARVPSMPPPFVAARGARPRVAVLREQGTNGAREMAAALDRAGFAAADVTMTDLLDGRARLGGDFVGAALCGGFSFGDALGAGRGWALGVLNDPKLADMFAAFFARPDVFVLGVCNGCQALACLRELATDGRRWRFPEFLPNESRRFEARLAMAEVLPSPSPLFADMAGLMYPLVVSHGEGCAVFPPADAAVAPAAAPMVLRYVDNHGAPAESYPQNPNGSVGGAAGFCSPDGRIVALMPHPERVFRSVQMGWLPPQTQGEETPWMRIFHNARRFVG